MIGLEDQIGCAARPARHRNKGAFDHECRRHRAQSRRRAVTPEGQGVPGHRLDQRYRTRHRPRPCRGRVRRRPQRLRQARGDRGRPGRRRRRFRRARRLFGGRHVETGLDSRNDPHDPRQVRQARCAGQQCRHSTRGALAGISRRQVGRHHRHQSQLGVPHHAPRASEHDRQQMGPHHQYRLGPRAGRLGLQVRLCRRQARHAWA